MIMVILGVVIAALIFAGLLVAFRWARPPLATYVPDARGRTREQTRAIELVTGLTVNHNALP